MRWEVNVSANDKQPFVNLDDLKDEYGHNILGYAACLPKYSKLDGNYFNMPNSLPSSGLGYLSSQISDEQGVFEKPIEINFRFARPKTSKGIKFVFNQLSGDYCSDLHIDWYRNNELILSEDYYPDNVEYICEGNVASWDEVNVTFNKTNKPKRYLFISLFDNYALTKTEGLKIIYNDIAVGSMDIVSPSSTDKVSYCDLELLKDESIIFSNVGLLLPRYSKLDGKYVNTSDIASESISYMSNSISNDQCEFETNPSIEFAFSEKISSIGITLVFNNYSGDYCNDVIVSWYSNNELILSKEFNPDDYSFFCYQQVDYYDKVKIEFIKTSKPYRNAFLSNIIFGVNRIYMEEDIVDCSCFMEISPISDELSINTLEFSVRKENDFVFDFQKRQLIQIYFDQQIYGNFYLKSGSKTNKYTHSISSEDAVSILDANSYVGGIYEGMKFSDLIDDIFEGEFIDYYVDDELADMMIYGYIPYGSKREALALACFSVGGIVDTSFDERLFIYPLHTEKERDIKLSEIYASPALSINNEDIVTGVNLTVHKYSKFLDENSKQELFNEELNGQATLTFDQPYHSYSIVGGSITKSGPNFCVITGSGSPVTLSGYQYYHETQIITMENENVFRNKKYVDVTDVTTITSNNASEVLSRLYDYYTKTESVSASILMGRNEIGSVVEIDTEFDGKRNGIIQSANLTFSSEVKGDIDIKCL